MPEVYHVQSFGVALVKGLDPVHLQLSGYGQQSLLPLPLRMVPLLDNLLRSIVFAFGFVCSKSWNQRMETRMLFSLYCFLHLERRKLQQICMSPAWLCSLQKKLFKSLLLALLLWPFSPLRATVRSTIPDTPLKSRKNTVQVYDPSFMTVVLYIVIFFFNIWGIGIFTVGLCMRCKNIIVAFPGLEG